MPTITLPDGSTRNFQTPVSALEVAMAISSGLANDTVGAIIDGTLSDSSSLIEQDASISLVTIRKNEKQSSEDALWLIRHSAAHVMAEALTDLFPGTLLVYGPPIENGFYYDILPPKNVSIKTEDFTRIENRMREIINEDRPFTRYDLDPQEGLEKLKDEGSKYKLDNAEKALENGANKVSWYATGAPNENFEDLCKGPHLPSTGKIGSFKLTSLAASYWHGDANSDSLLRIYGTAFATQKQLENHLDQIEEAKQRDHRIIGKKLQLFHIDDEVGPGLILWTPKGTILRKQLERFITKHLKKQGYEEVITPHIGKLDLYRTSGHYPYYQESQFPPLINKSSMQDILDTHGRNLEKVDEALEEGSLDGYLLRPMNCPHHIKIYSSQQRSYRELPIRLSEFGTVYRWEQSGEIGGLTRVRGFTQDDAHIFCTPDQVQDEIAGCLSLVETIFKTLQMNDFEIRVGLRDPDSSKYTGSDEGWDLAEKACLSAASSLGLAFKEEPGEAAFYGPKIDFLIKDSIGRKWQLGTIQVDYNLPERFKLTYTGKDNSSHQPVMIHRAPFGSFERFLGVLIEHFEGAFPTWLSPEQVRILPISEKTINYSKKVKDFLSNHGIRSTIDSSNERIQGKIRNASQWKIPYLLVVGPRDEDAETVSVRPRGFQKDLGAAPLQAFTNALIQEIQDHGISSAVETCFPKSKNNKKR